MKLIFAIIHFLILGVGFGSLLIYLSFAVKERVEIHQLTKLSRIENVTNCYFNVTQCYVVWMNQTNGKEVQVPGTLLSFELALETAKLLHNQTFSLPKGVIDKDFLGVGIFFIIGVVLISGSAILISRYEKEN